MKSLLILLIRGYRLLISPLFPSCCRFSPTCSRYAMQAIAQFGAWRGTLLAVKRILRCNPFCEGGYDPVPEVWMVGKTSLSQVIQANQSDRAKPESLNPDQGIDNGIQDSDHQL